MTCTVNAMIIASQYMIAPNLQQGFIDINSGLELSAGVVTFYRDEDHTQLKPVYTISGPPDDPVFTELPNPLTLSAIGTFEYMNNDIIPYYRPYDDDGNIDLYYITVYNADGDLQFTRDHYPTVPATSGGSTINAENFIPNGQFLMHLNLPNNGLIDPSVGFADIAYGGWSFQENIGTTSINSVRFIRYNAPILSPDQNPRYAVEVICSSANPSDSKKDLVNVIQDVNFMQGQILTFQITAYSNDGNSHDVDFIIGKDFGSGGSPSTEEVVATFTVTTEIQNFLVSFTMSSNIGSSIGTGDDDNISLILRGPLATTSSILYTNVILVAGTFGELTYPPITPEQDKAFTLPASLDIPAYDGSNDRQYLQLGQSTQNSTELGIVYNFPVPTGSVLPYTGATAPADFILCDGTAYSVDEGNDLPTYPNLFNLILGVSSAADGVTANLYSTYAFGTGLNGFEYQISGTNTLQVNWNRFDFSQPVPDAGTSGFTFTLVQSQSNYIGAVPFTPVAPFYGNKQIYTMTVLSGSAITPGSYYRLFVNTGGPQFIQLFWFTVDGIGVIPTSSTYDAAKRIDILSTDTATQVVSKIVRNGNALWQAPDLRRRLISFWAYGNSSIGRYPSEISATIGGINFSDGNNADTIGSTGQLQGIATNGATSNPYVIDSVNPSTMNFNVIIKT